MKKVMFMMMALMMCLSFNSCNNSLNYIEIAQKYFANETMLKLQKTEVVLEKIDTIIILNSQRSELLKLISLDKEIQNIINYELPMLGDSVQYDIWSEKNQPESELNKNRRNEYNQQIKDYNKKLEFIKSLSVTDTSMYVVLFNSNIKMNDGSMIKNKQLPVAFDKEGAIDSKLMFSFLWEFYILNDDSNTVINKINVK